MRLSEALILFCVLVGMFVLGNSPSAQARLLQVPEDILSQAPQWVAFGNKDQFTQTDDAITFTADGKVTNSHLDTTVNLKANVPYIFSSTITNQGQNLSPSVRIAHMNWTTLSMITLSKPSTNQTLSNVFTVEKDMTVRIQFFGYRMDHPRQGSPKGKASFTDFFIHQATVDQQQQMLKAQVTIDLNQTLSKTSPLFKGGNSLYWIDTPQFMQRTDYVQHLKDMGMSLMRFPAGEAADDYDWRVAVGNVPFEPSQTAGKANVPVAKVTQFDTFVSWAKSFNAQPIIVVNLETALANNNIQQGIELACDWVRYSNITKGYNIRYWEIGNESYLRGGHFPLTAEEYAQAFTQFAQAMKQVDPTIKVGANGPNHIYELGLMDRLPVGTLDEFRKLSRVDRKKPDIRDAYFQRPGQVTDKAKAWWPTLCGIAGNEIDFAVVHHYINPTDRAHFQTIGTRPLDWQRHFKGLRQYLTKQTSREIPLALTEWDVFHTVKSMTPYQVGLTNVEMAFNALNAGVKMSCFWPMRWPEGRWDELAMFTADAQPRPTYHMLKQLYSRLGDRVLACHVNGSNELFAGVTADAAKESLDCFLINRCGLKTPMQVTLPRIGDTLPKILCMTEQSQGKLIPLDVSENSSQLQIHLPPQSLVVVQYDSVNFSAQ